MVRGSREALIPSAFSILDIITYLFYNGHIIVDKNKPDYVNLVLFNYVKSIIENKEYEINLLNSNLEKYKGKVWNICFINNMSNECYKTLTEIEVLNDRILQGGIKLSLWETKG